ncbi:uncharacterized protein LOC141677956 [Apium graveolens]|uniref:uncharacterized protein LOC141677956 n=1 Tax=Apium graveolens TaxID=4045 RepID=UPI003D7B28F9
MRRSLTRIATPIGKTAGIFTTPFSSGSGRCRVPGARVDNSVSDDPTRPYPKGFGREVPEFIQGIEEEKFGEGIDDTVMNTRKADEDDDVRFGLLNVLAGTGRGKIVGSRSAIGIGVKKPENRFIRARHEFVNVNANPNVSTKNVMTQFDNPEDTKKNVMDILSSGDESDDDDYDYDDGCFIADQVYGEKLPQRRGPETMNQLEEGFEEIQNAFIEEMHNNCAIECEPEYSFGDCESDPDVDEKPPMTLRECFDKAMPFRMAYEHIQNHEELEEAVEDAMKQVPLMIQIVNYYSGPDWKPAKKTAGKLMRELERVAKTLPKSAPDSLKRFTNRAVLSIQVGLKELENCQGNCQGNCQETDERAGKSCKNSSEECTRFC